MQSTEVAPERQSAAYRVAGTSFFLGICLLCLKVLARRRPATPHLGSVRARPRHPLYLEGQRRFRTRAAPAFQYRVGSRTYSGERVRYVFRPFRIGLGEATSSTLTWGAGKTVAVYFNSGHPEEALLDKGLTTGDWLFLTLVLAVLIAASGGIARNLTFETRPNC